MNHIKVSVITICLNSVETIEQTIQSVISQAYDNIEYIIIDGGSTDGTLDVIRKYEKNIAFWVSEPDRGIYDAMNKGISRATGDIVGIINSTDWYAKDAISIVAQFFSDNPETEFIHGFLMEIADDGAERLYRGIDPQIEQAGDWYPHPTVFIKRTLYERFGMYDGEKYPIFADADLMLNLKQKKVDIKKICKVLAYFRLGGLSNSAGNRWKRISEVKRLILDKIDSSEQSPQTRKELSLAMNKYIQHEVFEYAINRIQTYYSLEIVLSGFLSWNKKQSFIIWGCGDDGKQLYGFFENCTALVDYFVDKDEKLTGTLYLGKVIKDISCISKDYFIIISTRKYYSQVKDSIQNRGYNWGEDYLSYNDFIYNIIVGAFPRIFTLKKAARDNIINECF